MSRRSSFFHKFFKIIFSVAISNILVAFSDSSTFVIDIPTTVIGGRKSGIKHPEGIAFSPSSDYFAVANAHANSISFYKKSPTNDIGYETSPFFIIEGAESRLDFPHDLSFSPDGCHLAVANRNGNSITVYKKNPNDFYFSPSPITVIEGEASGLAAPDAIKYSPLGNVYAVANTKTHIITLYHYQGDQYEQSPYQILQNSVDILNLPDGLAFSLNGELLAVANHANNSVVFYQKLVNSSYLYLSNPVEILQGKETNFFFTHSLCFHPLTDDLVVSNAGGKKILNIFKKNSNTFPRYSTFPEKTLEIFSSKTIRLQDKNPQEGGVKGVAFSPDGNYLGLCVSNIKKSDRSILIYSINKSTKN